MLSRQCRRLQGPAHQPERRRCRQAKYSREQNWHIGS
jgi:hypothetical protein